MTSSGGVSMRKHALLVLLPTLHRWCLGHVKTTAHFVAMLSQAHLPLVDAACGLVSSAADSLLYMSLLSFLALSVDHAVARKMVLMWCVAVYLANFMQDTLLLPRPFHISGGVVVLEVKHGERYGLPCVKTLSATCLPFYFVVLVREHEDADLIIPIAFAFAVSWCFLVGFSRMDLGRNTPADVIAGHLLGHMVIGTWVLCGDYIDELLVRPYGALPWLIPIFFALCLMAYPTPMNGSPSFIETAIVLGWGAGWAVASCWFLIPTSGPLTAALDQSAATAMVRACVGGLSIVLTYSCVVRFFEMVVPPLSCFTPVEDDVRKAVMQTLQAQPGYNGSGAATAAAGGGGGGGGGGTPSAVVTPSGTSTEVLLGGPGSSGSSTPNTSGSNVSSSSKKSNRATDKSAKIAWSNASSTSISKTWAAVGYEKAIPVLFLSFMCVGFSASFTTPMLLNGMGLI